MTNAKQDIIREKLDKLSTRQMSLLYRALRIRVWEGETQITGNFVEPIGRSEKNSCIYMEYEGILYLLPCGKAYAIKDEFLPAIMSRYK